jgi:Protein of unknown function (DUF3179)
MVRRFFFATIDKPDHGEFIVISRFYRFTLFTATAIALFFLVYPNFVIRPERPQGARELQAALLVLRYQHLAELLCAALALLALTFYLRAKPVSGRKGMIACAAVVVLCAGLSRVNIYELLFRPAGVPSFQPVNDAQLDGADHLLTVNRAAARAYPIRTLAYHHIVNDVVGGVPIAVTY